MKAEDFSAWLSAISGMSEAAAGGGFGGAGEGRRRRWAFDEDRGGSVRGRAWNGGRRARRGSGLSPLRGPRGRRLGPLGRAFAVPLQELRAHLNALTKTPMAHLRKKEKWLDHARAMIEGKSLAKTAALCGVHPTTAFRWRHRFLRARPQQAANLAWSSSKRTKPSGSNPSRAAGPIYRARLSKRGGTARHPGLHQEQHSRSRRPRPDGRDLRCGPAPGRQRFGEGRPRRGRHAGQPSDRRRRQGDRGFRPPSRDTVPRPVPSPGKPAPRPRICISTTSTPTIAVLSSGSAASTASQPRTSRKGFSEK